MPDETVRSLLAKATRRQRESRLELEALQRLIDDYRAIQNFGGTKILMLNSFICGTEGLGAPSSQMKSRRC